MKKGIGVILVIVLASCQNKSGNATKYEKLATMNWLLGNWENKMEEGDLSESWVKKNDSTFVGQSYFIKGKDTLSFESIQLIQKDDVISYIPTVKGQNKDKPVTFKLTMVTETEFTFENPTHDYPQKIVYKKAGPTDFVASISGIQQGKKNSESYPMKKK